MATNQTASLQMTNLRKPVLRALAPLRLPEPLALKMLCGQTARMQKKMTQKLQKILLPPAVFPSRSASISPKQGFLSNYLYSAASSNIFGITASSARLPDKSARLGKDSSISEPKQFRRPKNALPSPRTVERYAYALPAPFPTKAAFRHKNQSPSIFRAANSENTKDTVQSILPSGASPWSRRKSHSLFFRGSADTQRDKRDTRSLFFQDIIYNSIQNSVHNFSKGVRAYPPQFAPLAPDILTRFLQTYAQRFRRSPEPVPESPDQRVTEPRGQISQTLPQGQLVIKIETENGLNSRVAVLDGSDLNIGLVTL